MSALFVCLSLLVILFLVIVFLLKFTQKSSPSDTNPGPPRSLILGSILGTLELLLKQSDFWKDPQTRAIQLLAALSYAYQKEGLFFAKLGPFERAVVLYNADTVEPVLTSSVHIEKSRQYMFATDWLGTGLLLSSGDKWRSRRKLLTPSFHFKILEDFVPVINGQLRQMMAIIDRKMDQNGIVEDVRPIITNCTLDIICETAMGREVHAQQQPDSEYVRSVRQVLPMAFARFMTPWLYNDTVYRLSSSGKEYLKRVGVLHKFTNSVIKERKQEIISNNNRSDEFESTDGIGRKKKMMFLDALLKNHLDGHDIDESGIREEVDTFMFEGHDTTSSALHFSTYLIGLHMDVQSKIHEELDQIFGDDIERDITLADMTEMKYLEQTIKESLRLYPPVPFVGRLTREPVKVGQHVIPANTTCMLFFYQLHRDPKVFPRPEVFDPSRFDPSVHYSSDANAFTYVPFSAGPRNCIGQKFALLEVKAVLAALLRKYRIRSLLQRDKLETDSMIILKPKSKIEMQFENRF